MYNRCVIQIQQLSSSGFPISNWQDVSHMNSPTDMMIMHEMNVLRNRFNGRVRIRATDERGRMIDMLAT